MSYTRLTAADREVICVLFASDVSPSDIARQLHRPRSTITRELAKHCSPSGTYSAVEAHSTALRIAKQRQCRSKMERFPILRAIVTHFLGKGWSPEQVSAFLVRTYPDDRTMQISDESIYTYIYVLPRGSLKKSLIAHLRHKKPHRGRRATPKGKQGAIPEMISIEERPAAVADRIVPGHWEGDLIMGAGNRSAIGTLVERTTRWVFLVKLNRKDASSVRRAFAREVKSLPPQLARSLTYDQGREMTEHKLFTEQTKIKVYFAHPHSPWERGTNENTNGLIRDFFPHGTDFSKVTKHKLKNVQQLLNERPRKTLLWHTPAEAFSKLLR